MMNHASSAEESLASPRFFNRLYFAVLGAIPFASFFLRGARLLRHRLWPYQEVPEKGKYTLRTGTCNQCGDCCKNLLLTYGKQVIQSIEDFKALQALHPQEYGFFEPIDHTDAGLVFKCHHLGDDDLCLNYNARPTFCRSYPTEAGLLMGAKLPQRCSFSFVPLQSFEAALQAVDLQNV